MPTYQYACTACGERSEAVQSFTDAPLTECTACGGTLRKVFSAVGVVFKGSGFYKTDSRKAPAGSSAKSGDSGEGKSGESTPATANAGDSASSGKSDKSPSTTSSGTSSSSGSDSSSTPASKTA